MKYVTFFVCCFVTLFCCGCEFSDDFNDSPVAPTQVEEVVAVTDTDLPSPDKADNQETGDQIVTDDRAKDVVVDDVFWLSDKGVLHNSLCRWYRKSAGKEWDGETEHKNCDLCGGDKPIVRVWNLPKGEK